MNRNVIHCGECAEVMIREMPDGSIDLTVTSPPYDKMRKYKGYTFDFEAIAAQLWRVTKQGGVVVWVVGDATVNGSESGTSFRQALGFMELGFNLHDTMIYSNSKPPLTHNRYEQAFEYMFVFSKGVPRVTNLIRKGRSYRTGGPGRFRENSGGMRSANSPRQSGNVVAENIWYYSTSYMWKDAEAIKHPARFPEALARDHILSWSNSGDVVLDPMCGSGTTAKMSVLTDRQYIGIDVSEEYCDLARKRVARAKRQPALLSYGDTERGKPEQIPLFAEELSP